MHETQPLSDAPQALACVDCYPKRILRATSDTSNRAVRFIPCGLHHAARSTAMSARLQAILHWRAVYGGRQAHGLRQKVAGTTQVDYRLIRRRTGYSQKASMYIEPFEGAQVVNTPQILFATHACGEDGAPYAMRRQAANETREALIRALRKTFADRSVGGLRPSQHAVDQCVARCEYLLQNAQRAQQLREIDHLYDRRHVGPEALMRACLPSASSAESQASSSGVAEKSFDAS